MLSHAIGVLVVGLIILIFVLPLIHERLKLDGMYEKKQIEVTYLVLIVLIPSFMQFAYYYNPKVKNPQIQPNPE